LIEWVSGAGVLGEEVHVARTKCSRTSPRRSVTREKDISIKGSEEKATITRRDGELVTAGGRVLAVSALGDDFTGARARAYENAALIDFEGKHLRTDIALRAEGAS
jgi:phosphoribosylamine-glycine ligase